MLRVLIDVCMILFCVYLIWLLWSAGPIDQ
jgi:hypothetical protein